MSDGRLVVRYPRVLQGWFWLAFLFVLFAPIYLIWLRPGKAGVKVIPLLLLFLTAGASILPFLWEVTWWRVEVRDDGLHCRSPWRGSWAIAWDDIRCVSWAMPRLVIEAKTGRWFRVNSIMVGRDRLLAELERRLTAEQLRPAGPGYVWLGRPFPGTAAGPGGWLEGIDLTRWGERPRGVS